MADITTEKTEEEKLRLKQERAERRKQKKYESRAEKRGISVEALKDEYHQQEVEETQKASSSINKKKRSREEMEQKVQKQEFWCEFQKAIPWSSINLLTNLTTVIGWKLGQMYRLCR